MFKGRFKLHAYNFSLSGALTLLLERRGSNIGEGSGGRGGNTGDGSGVELELEVTNSVGSAEEQALSALPASWEMEL